MQFANLRFNPLRSRVQRECGSFWALTKIVVGKFAWQKRHYFLTTLTWCVDVKTFLQKTDVSLPGEESALFLSKYLDERIVLKGNEKVFIYFSCYSFVVTVLHWSCPIKKKILQQI